jgi:hypothetical protein
MAKRPIYFLLLSYVNHLMLSRLLFVATILHLGDAFHDVNGTNDLWPHGQLLKYFMMRGPRILGCWEGDTTMDICARLSGVTSSMWHDNQFECDALINRRVESMLVLGETVVVLTLLYHGTTSILQIGWCRLFYHQMHTPIHPQIYNPSAYMLAYQPSIASTLKQT